MAGKKKEVRTVSSCKVRPMDESHRLSKTGKRQMMRDRMCMCVLHAYVSVDTYSRVSR